MERRFARDISALDGLFDFIERFAAARGVGERALFTLKLAAEELFMNLLRHNTGGGDEIAVTLDADGARLVMTLVDFDVDPVVIDPERPVDTAASLEDRAPGGLGIHLVKSMVDSLVYEYADRVFRVTAIKKLEEGHV